MQTPFLYMVRYLLSSYSMAYNLSTGHNIKSTNSSSWNSKEGGETTHKKKKKYK